jgi:RNA polymerase sigma factor for flagellar operon FliA
MIDGLRASGSPPRGLRQSVRLMRRRTSSLEQTLSRAPSNREIAAAMGIELSEYQRIVYASGAYRAVTLDPQHRFRRLSRIPVRLLDPLEAMVNTCERQSLLEAIVDLPVRERVMLRLYYDGALTLQEIGLIFGISESRVCQMLTDARALLRDWLTRWGREAVG